MPTSDARQRHHRPYGGHESDPKIEFGKDYDHLLYSSAFRRLGGVTQVVGVNETALFHNRMTHSLKVAQVGRRLTKKLLDKMDGDRQLYGVVEEYGGGLDSSVVYAACIAHDLGRPPFGYIAEMALRKLTTGRPDTPDHSGAQVSPTVGEGEELSDSFSNHAQTFRIVNKLAFRESYGDGKSAALNLTRATLAALLVYPWSCSERTIQSAGWGDTDQLPSWGYYDSEKDLFEFVCGLVRPRRVTLPNGEERTEHRTVEAQVVDWADDISYAIHDVEDFFRARLIPLDILGRSDERFAEFFDYAWSRVERVFVSLDATRAQRQAARERVERFLSEARTKLPVRPYTGSRYDREDLHTFASAIIRSATDHTELTRDGLVRPAERDLAIIEIFKQLVWYYVMDSPTFAPAQRGHVYLIRRLFRDLAAWVRDEYVGSEGGRGNLPARLREYTQIALHPDPAVGCLNYRTDEQKLRRAVVDYICSLTERQVIQLATQLQGTGSRPLPGNWFYA